MKQSETIHTTLNLSAPLIKKAMKLFKGKSKTEIIHEGLEKMVKNREIEIFIRKHAGKTKIIDYGK